MDAYETAQAQYRPEVVDTLFVGESRPVKGGYFYFGRKTGYERYMQQGLEGSDAVADGLAFLDRFKDRGYYLEDLSPVPVDHLKGKARRVACQEAVNHLAQRIARLNPRRVVVIQRSIRDEVTAAVRLSGCRAEVHYLPFPGNGWQNKFVAALEELAGR